MKNSRFVGAIVSGIVLLMATMALGQSSTTFVQTVNKATLNGTNFTLASSANPSTYTANVTFTASLPADATGTVVFFDGATNLGSGTVSSGAATFSISTLTAGTHSITGQYSGDSNYNSATSATLSQVVNKATPTITWATPAGITYGTALSATQLNATASVPGTFVYTPAAGTILASGSQTLSVTFTPTDGSDYTTASATVTLSVGKLTPTITWANPAAITYGTALSATQLNATASTPGTFVYSPVAGTVLTAGSHVLSVTFTPTDSADYTGATGTATIVVNKALPAITVASSLNPSTYGANVTLTATLPGASTGSVTFYDGATSIGTGTITSGTATLSTLTLAVGTHSITVQYAGDSNFTADTSAVLSQVVNKGGVTFAVASSANPSTYGSAVTLTITVTGSNGVTPTGNVTVSDSLGWTSQVVPLVSGVGTLTTSTLPAGTNTLTIVYGGDPVYQIVKGPGSSK